MRPISENTVIQIDVTNACHLSCQGCTRHVGHHRKPYFMTVDHARKAIASLDGFDGQIGMMGGEPSLHPRFRELLALWEELVPRRRRALWTAGFKWLEYRDEVYRVFDRDLVHYNDHVAYDGMHKPLLIAIDDVVDDGELKAELIDNCPYQTHWSASITPKGGFFCEIAASLDWLLEGPGGYELKPGWWRKTPSEFRDQVDRYCGSCSGAIPMPARSDGRGGRDGKTTDVISPSNLSRLAVLGSPKVRGGNYEVFDGKLTREDIEKYEGLNPRAFRSFEAHSPEDVERHLTAAG